ncbi:bifunctional diguanylate cyclase/phosphodiesterase [Planktothrix sp. FACHB-1365]|uniref:putative bifunctional diguanylate cyclase/phosphodiesterase n=1 Tax=Planktothrix sp. FACHB-1365 TaxID=2692855 RepID=UPI0016826120|nr:EAL domain-containing protein [Planktothrix sp. FACHB-1365]MBD2482878.1 EAL domain-containing protein [Planktothrix sp. FACHB-1365]
MKLRLIRSGIHKILYETSFWIGGLVGILIVSAIEVSKNMGFRVPIPFLTMGFTVILCANLGGLKTGLACTSVISIYIIYIAWIKWVPSVFTPEPIRISLVILLILITAILLGRTTDKKNLLIKTLKTTQNELKKRVLELAETNALLERENQERQQMEAVLQSLILETASVTGVEFFPALAQHLGLTLGFRYVIVTEVIQEIPGRVRTLAFWGGDHFLENTELDLDQTLCNEINKTRSLTYFPDRVQELFPHLSFLVELQVISSIGVPIISHSEQIIGYLCLLHDQPIKNEDRTQSLIHIFAGRIVAELERKQAEEAQQKAEAKYRSIFENAIEGIFQSTPDGYYLSANPALARIYGYDSPEDLIQNLRNISEQLYVNPKERQEFTQIMLEQGQISGFEYQVYRQDRQVIWISENSRSVYDNQGNILYYEGTVEDITQRKLAEEKLLYNAFYDELTSLPNRALFIDRVQQSLAHSQRRSDSLFAVLYVDLDRFKVINDSLGHAVGNQLLIDLSQRLINTVREGDTVARLNGDEFAVLVEDIQEIEDATQIAERISLTLSQPFQLEQQEVFTSASIGITFNFQSSGHLYESAEELLQDADTAMRHAKYLGQGSPQLFDQKMQKNFRSRLQLETDLRRAIERDELLLNYQLIVSLLTGEIAGFEALVRWNHPKRGLVSPVQFIPLAEETGLIVPIGEWVLRTACKQMRQWQIEELVNQNVTMSVNVAGRQFAQLKLVNMIHDILQETGLDAKLLRLEITEGVIMEHFESATAQLQQLRDLGIQLSIDDFGTGYSSLSRLQQFPIDILKIDRSFVSPLGSKAENREIVETIINLAVNLKMSVVAEGVETLEQILELKQLGCHYGQGYFFSRPLDSEGIRQLILNHQFKYL